MSNQRERVCLLDWSAWRAHMSSSYSLYIEHTCQCMLAFVCPNRSIRWDLIGLLRSIELSVPTSSLNRDFFISSVKASYFLSCFSAGNVRQGHRQHRKQYMSYVDCKKRASFACCTCTRSYRAEWKAKFAGLSDMIAILPAYILRVNSIFSQQLGNHCQRHADHILVVSSKWHCCLQHRRSICVGYWRGVALQCARSAVPACLLCYLTCPRPIVYFPGATPSYFSRSAWSTCIRSCISFNLPHFLMIWPLAVSK